MVEKYDFDFGLAAEKRLGKSEVHKLSFAPAAYLPLLYRLISMALLCSPSIILTFKKWHNIFTNK
jgi:hypothetical protein